MPLAKLTDPCVVAFGSLVEFCMSCGYKGFRKTCTRKSRRATTAPCSHDNRATSREGGGGAVAEGWRQGGGSRWDPVEGEGWRGVERGAQRDAAR